MEETPLPHPEYNTQYLTLFSVGTQGVDNAKNAVEIIGCSLVNAKATAEYIERSGMNEVLLVCMGWAGAKKADEDTLCADGLLQ